MKSIIKKINNLPKAVKASIAFFLASIITTGISYLITPIYTRMLTPEEYGLVAVFTTTFQIFGTVAMFCLHYGVFNNGMTDYPEDRDEYCFSILILSNIISLVCSIIFLASGKIVYKYTGIDLPLMILMVIICFFQPAYNFWVSRQRYELKYRTTVLWSIITAIVSPACAISLILLFPGNRVYGRIFGAQGSLVIIYIGFYLFLGRKNSFQINRKYWKEAFFFNLPLIPHYLSTYLLSTSDKLMISYLVGTAATAYYSVAYAVAAIALIVWSAVNSSLVPFTYQKCKNKEFDRISSVTTPILLLFAMISILVIMLAPEVVSIMATSDYMEAIVAIPPIVGGVFFQVLYYIFSNIVYYYKKPKYVMYASVTAMLLNLILNYFCIQKWGYIAAGYTTLVCYMIQAIIDYFAMKHVVGKSVYNTKFLICISLSVIFISVFGTICYKYTLIRYIIVILVVMIGIIKRDKIQSMFLNLKGK